MAIRVKSQGTPSGTIRLRACYGVFEAENAEELSTSFGAINLAEQLRANKSSPFDNEQRTE
jgi:hypothetical protein